MEPNRWSWLTAMAGLLLAAGVTAARADDPRDQQTRLMALEAKLAAQEQEIAALKKQMASGGPSADDTRMREMIAKTVQEELAKTEGVLAKWPKWLDGLEFSGDLRLRYEGQFHDGGSSDDRNRTRFRLRLKIVKQITDEVKMIVRLASGSASANGIDHHLGSDPTSTNQSFEDGFSEKPFWIDQAWVQYKPKRAKGLELAGGKFQNPFPLGGWNDLVWDGDVNPEGFYERYERGLCEGVKAWVLAAQAQMTDHSSDDENTWMIAFQGGASWQMSERTASKFAASYYHFINAERNVFSANGNTGTSSHLAAEEFDVVELAGELNIKDAIASQPLKFFGEAAFNASSHDGQNAGFQVGVQLGSAKKKGQWQASYAYKYLEANAVLGWLTDSDFGFTDRRGHIVKVTYKLADNVAVGGALFFTESISANRPNEAIFQADVIVNFP